MFDANQMLKENNPKLSSEFVADIYAHARVLKDKVTRQPLLNILFLICVFLCIVTSSLVCEAGFSKIILVKTKLRNRLCVPNLDTTG